jgi:hypothetical protein
MDRTKIVNALRHAQTAVISHGIINRVPERYKSAMLAALNEYSDSLQYEFYLDPKKSAWDSDNFSCSLVIAYLSDKDYEHDGGIYREYVRRISIRHGASDVDAASYKKREDFIASLLMLVEMLEAITPENIRVTVETPDEVSKRKRRELEQKIGEQIHFVLEKKNLKNLRRGGNSRTIRFPESLYKTNYGALPTAGTYAYKHPLRKDRNGRVTNFGNYIFRVMEMDDGAHYLKIFKVT